MYTLVHIRVTYIRVHAHKGKTHVHIYSTPRTQTDVHVNTYTLVDAHVYIHTYTCTHKSRYVRIMRTTKNRGGGGDSCRYRHRGVPGPRQRSVVVWDRKTKGLGPFGD